MSLAANSLILDYLNPKRNSSILVLEGSDGWLASEAARLVPDGRVLSLARDIREVRAAQTRLSAYPNAAATRDVYPTTDDWDVILLTIPKSRRFARSLLLAAWRSLNPGGQLLLAGPSKAGAKAVIKDAERLFGNASVLGYRRHQRVAACLRSEMLPDPLPKEYQQPGIAPGTQHFIQIDHSGGSLKLKTHPGIFSWEALDEGTALLLEYLKVDSGSNVWDVGCGYGAIGLSAVLAGAAFSAMSDCNLIAVDYAQTNAFNNRLDKKVKVFPADTLSYPPRPTSHQAPRTPISQFDLIVSNPAFHQGHAVDKSMAGQLITRAPDFLTPAGRLVIVANRFLNYDNLMRAHFEHVTRIAETSKYHIIEAHKRK